MYADVGSNGRVNDSCVWNKTSLLQGIEEGTVILPKKEKLSNGEDAPYVFLGDDAFVLKKYMMKAFSSTRISPREKNLQL